MSIQSEILFIFVSLKIHHNLKLPIPVAAQSQARVFGHSLAGVAGSNSVSGMVVSLSVLRVLCVVT
jgi:hypothetical protein